MMQTKHYTLFITLMLLPLFSMTAQQAGDLAFIGFNADGNDDFAVVTFVELAPNTTIYFRDSEWNGTAFGTDEQVFAWNTGAEAIPAGTVVAFNNTSGTSTVSIGSIPSNAGMGLSSSDEAIFAYTAAAPDATPTILAAIGNAPNSFGSLTGTGLTQGSTAILLPTGVDVALYNGTRTGLDKNGYLAALNDIATNWITQDGSGDQHNDGTAPDLPFNLTNFTISTVDNTPPSVASVSVTSAKIWELRFTEPLNETSAETAANYQITPALIIDSLRYNAANNSVLLYQSGMSDGVDYQLIVSNVEDANNNAMMMPFVEPRLVWNTSTPKLLITEIMYNPPAANADSLEFFEIVNAGTTPAIIGGLTVRDQNPSNGNFGQVALLMPSQTLAPGGILLVAPDGSGAKNYYGKDFIDLGFIGNALGNGGEALVIKNSLGVTIDSVNYDDAAPWPTSADGSGPSLERKTLMGLSSDGNNWRASTTAAGQVGGLNVFASPGVFVPFVTPSVAFSSTHSIFTEGAASATITLNISQAPLDVVTVQLQTVDLTAQVGTDAILASTAVVFPAGSNQPQTIQITLPENMNAESDRYFAIRLGNITNGLAGDLKEHFVYIKDNDQTAIVPTEEILLEYKTSFPVADGGSAEIVAFDSGSGRLFVVNSTQVKLEIITINPSAVISKLKTIDMSTYGSGIQSVAVYNGLVAAAVDVADFGNGKVVFFNTDGDFLKEVTVGNLPDMLTFTPDGKRLLVANEGQPNSDYTIDPEGSISVIEIPTNIANLQQSDVKTISFNNFDGDLNALLDAGVRIYGPGATVSEDLEPEYIAVSKDNKTAWVTLQENNALAIIDLQNLQAVQIVPLGYKDYTEPTNTLDASDRTSGIIFANFPVFGMYQPDAIASFQVGDETYLITANEGDAREYDALEEEVAFANLPLDPLAFPNGDLLKSTIALGRLNVVNTLGDFDGDGDFDAAYTLGARSFSIWDRNGNLVYDSGDQLERITAADPTWGALFNASNGNNNFKNRSDNKGPEPEGVVTATINGNAYAFIALERIGGVMVFNISNPEAPVFVQYVNSRDLGTEEGGDLGPEGLIYISESASPIGVALLVIANEVSGTLSFYSLDGVVATNEVAEAPKTMVAFPNPAKDQIFLERTDDYRVFDLQGRELQRIQQTNVLNVSNLSNEMYVIVREDGAVAKVAVQK